jgi:tRNA nucleotidyltransferase (CCA-adding enzyme)
VTLSLPDALLVALRALRPVGRPRLVGGCVRDALLGLAPTDFDVEVAGLSFDTLHARLAPLGATDVVGRSFGVIKWRRDGVTYDFSLPRRESKTGAGHRGFRVHPDPQLSDAEAAARRDFTLNAIAWDPFTAQLIDPLDGAADLRAGILRHVGPAFVEDPLRVLRGMQLAARFNFTLAPETAALSRSIASAYAELPVERVWGEWDKWATAAIRPSRGLEVLEATGWLQHFPEIAVLRGTPQEPEWHPEGDVFVHTGHCLDALVSGEAWPKLPAARRRQLSFAVLAHDFGKPATTEQAERQGRRRWISHGHEAAGVPPTERFLRRIGAPLDLAPLVTPLVRHHLAHLHAAEGPPGDRSVRRLARRLAPATIDDLGEVMLADSRGRPPLRSPETEAAIAELRRRAADLRIADTAPRPLLQGRHLIAAGLPPGPAFAPLLREAFEAQLDGVFDDEEGARRWLDFRLRAPAPDTQDA